MQDPIQFTDYGCHVPCSGLQQSRGKSVFVAGREGGRKGKREGKRNGICPVSLSSPALPHLLSGWELLLRDTMASPCGMGTSILVFRPSIPRSLERSTLLTRRTRGISLVQSHAL